MPPPFKECGRALSVAHVRACVRVSVRVSVRPSFKWVLCELNSSYNFIPILLKLYRCFCQGLKMCMTFGYNPQINFCHFFHSLNLVIFRLNYNRSLWDIRYLVSTTPPTILSQSFWNFTGVFVKDGRCAWHLDITLRLIFVTVRSLNSRFLGSTTAEAYRHYVPCLENVSAKGWRCANFRCFCQQVFLSKT